MAAMSRLLRRVRDSIASVLDANDALHYANLLGLTDDQVTECLKHEVLRARHESDLFRWTNVKASMLGMSVWPGLELVQ